MTLAISVISLLLLLSPLPSHHADSAERDSAPLHSFQHTGLPISKVVLYSSGVGYFQHDGVLDGQQTLDLAFRLDQINDVLKSLVVQDLGKGAVSMVTYGSRDPVTRMLGSFAVNLTGNPSLAQVLDQLRGEPVEILTPNTLNGTIIGVERKEQAVLHETGRPLTVHVEYLNLLTDDGIRSLPFSQIQRIKVVNQRVNADLQQALAALAGAHDMQKRPLSIHFQGEGRRQVRVAYVAESPVWKTTYRLVLDDAASPLLQGWAIVENSTEADWEHVQLSLISGRPISFVMDLYESLYASRPVVVPELYAGLKPRTYGQSIEEAASAEAKDALRDARADAAAKARSMLKQEAFAGRAPAAELAPAAPAPFGLQEGVAATARGQEAGELFEYAISVPVTLARHASAMLPIVNERVGGEKVSIYNQGVHQKYPVNGYRLLNKTALYLMQGPITVFDGNSYAGDGRIDDVAPGQERLLSYALDLKTEVESKSEAGQQELVTVSLRKGVLLATQKLLEERSYRVKNRDQKAKTVLLEHPYRPDWQLTEPSGSIERSRDVYRFAVRVAPGKSDQLRVREEKQLQQTLQLSDFASDRLAYYLQARHISPKVKEALQRIVTLRDRAGDTARRRGALEQRIREMTQEQSRIRDNMGKLAQTSELYARYVKKLDQQESEIDKLRKEIEALKATEEEQRRELNDFMLGLDIG
jgi:hypothetical protein